MTKIVKCIIVDDEPLAVQLLKGYVERIPQLELVNTCNNSMEAFEVMHQQSIDLLFLDIEMPGLNGIEFIKGLHLKPHVILTTAFREYAIESYEIAVIDYLLKPFSFTRFFKAVSKLPEFNVEGSTDRKDKENSRLRSSMYVYSDKKNVKVYFDDIFYIESIKDYVRIHTREGNVISKDTISRYADLLPKNFLRIHRSFIVNIEKIDAFTQHDVEIGAKELPIGVSYKKKVLEFLKQ